VTLKKYLLEDIIFYLSIQWDIGCMLTYFAWNISKFNYFLPSGLKKGKVLWEVIGAQKNKDLLEDIIFYLFFSIFFWIGLPLEDANLFCLKYFKICLIFGHQACKVVSVYKIVVALKKKKLMHSIFYLIFFRRGLLL
jgi:hypothetical protein